MEFEFWWLLVLPLFFSLGWLAARIDIKHLLSESRALPESYFKGLNFLLNEQPDKAIEAFTEVAKSGDPEAIELHFALGSLFRRRGEMERAIRLHQSLLERPELRPEDKEKILFELAHDYQKAGLLDRAEQLYKDLAQSSAHREMALKPLLDVYVNEKEWVKAIEVAGQLGAVSSHAYQNEIAHFYCELGAAAWAHSNSEEARQYLSEALRVYRRCVRANIMLGDFELTENDPASAVQYWKRIETQSPMHLHLVAGKLLSAYRSMGQTPEGVALLKNYLNKYPSVDLLNEVFHGTLETEGAHVSYRLVRDELRRNPSIRGLDKLLEAQLLDAPAERRQDMQLIKNLIHQQTLRLSTYRCDNCGFEARQFYWHCPACGGWDTFPPKRREETETV